MQKGKNTDETMKFFYVLILFLSIFLVIIVCDSIHFHVSRPCMKDNDCAPVKYYNIRCRKGFCVQIRKY